MSKERRKHKRRPILATFSLSLVVPRKGPNRLEILDVSDSGVGFWVDEQGESPEHFPLKAGELIEADFFLNQRLSIPLSLEVIRVQRESDRRFIGAEFATKDPASYEAYIAFLKLIDRLAEIPAPKR